MNVYLKVLGQFTKYLVTPLLDVMIGLILLGHHFMPVQYEHIMGYVMVSFGIVSYVLLVITGIATALSRE